MFSVGRLRLKKSNKSENNDVCVITFSGMLCAKHLRRNSEYFGRKLQSLSQETSKKCRFQHNLGALDKIIESQ